MGNGLYRDYSNLLLLIGYNASIEMLFGPCYLGSKGLQNTRKISPAKGKAKLPETSRKRRGNFVPHFGNLNGGDTAWKRHWNVSKPYPKITNVSIPFPAVSWNVSRVSSRFLKRFQQFPGFLKRFSYYKVSFWLEILIFWHENKQINNPKGKL